jgi:hypothetical protein
LPAAPEDVEPDAGRDADGVGAVVAAGPGFGREVGGPAERDDFDLPDLVGRGCGTGEAGECFGRREAITGIADPARSRAARLVPARGSVVKIAASGCWAS